MDVLQCYTEADKLRLQASAESERYRDRGRERT